MGDIGKRAAMDKNGVAIQGLHEIWLHGVLEERVHGAMGAEIACGHGRARMLVGDHHIGKPPFQVLRRTGQTENRHHFRSGGEVKSSGPETIGGIGDQLGVPQCTIRDIQGPPPHDAVGVDAEPISPVEMVVEQGRQQVVGGADRVNVAGQVQVDVIRRNDLREAAAGSRALAPETRP